MARTSARFATRAASAPSLAAAGAPAAAAPATTPAAAVLFAEEMPRFRGHGLDSVQAYVQQHIRYPDDAFIANASGRVFVSFVVNTQGKVEQVKVVKGVFPSLDREAARVVGALPTWTSPGRHKGQAVSVAYTVAVAFQMEMAMLAMRGQAGRPSAARATALEATGPTFPGGPDSLRAYSQRGAWQAGSSAQGLVMVEFDVDNNGHPRNIKALVPPSTKAQPTPTAYQAAVRLIEQSPTWNPGPASAQRHQIVPFAFGTAKLPPAFSRTDLRYPTYPGTEPTLESLTRYIQQQAQYPAEAVQRHQQGRVYVSFEVSETGEVEQVQIIGSAAPSLDAEVLRIIKSLPKATTPPISAGLAVRTSFTLPISFRME